MKQGESEETDVLDSVITLTETVKSKIKRKRITDPEYNAKICQQFASPRSDDMMFYNCRFHGFSLDMEDHKYMCGTDKSRFYDRINPGTMKRKIILSISSLGSTGFEVQEY